MNTRLGRKPKEIPPITGEDAEEDDVNSFRWLSEEYRNNDYEDTLVDALNTLRDDERNLIILFVSYRNKLAPLARYFHVSTPFLRKRLNDIRQKVILAYEEMLSGKESNDYRVDRYRKLKEEQAEARKRPLVQVELYGTEKIGEFDSPSEAAETIGGNEQNIRNCCNGSSFKYMGYRWLWTEDYDRITSKKHWKWYS